jgi:hypothetical protein
MGGLLEQAERTSGTPRHLSSKETAEAAAEPNRTISKAKKR